MTNALVQFRDNGRIITRNITQNRAKTRYELDMQEDEVKDVVLDFTAILAASETITEAVAADSTALTATITVASPLVTVRFSSLTRGYNGELDLLVTRSGGQKHRVTLWVRSVDFYTDRHRYHAGVHS